MSVSNSMGTKKIEELVANKSMPQGMQFFVPNYQRGYRWKESQVQQLLNDLREFDYEKGNESRFYCLQPLVVKEDKEKGWVVIDGQQRLTTLFIILTCIEKMLYKEKAKLYVMNYQNKTQMHDWLRRVDDLDEEGQRKLLETLAKRFGMELSKSTEKKQDDWDDEDDFFNPNDMQDDSFPERPVRNRDYLKRHVYEQFYCADPVTYENVLRRIRTSKSTKTDRAYVEGMYVNSSNKCVCQICKKVTEFHETIQIANYGIEMPQLNLCLCKDCAARYKAYCFQNKNTNYNDAFRDVVLGFNTDTEEALYTIELEPDFKINFTQTHIVELQEIFDLIYRYGLPKKFDGLTEESVVRNEKVVEKIETPEKKGCPEKKDNYTLARELKEKLSGKQESAFVPSIVAEVDAKEATQGAEEPDDVAKEGSFVSYKKLGPNMQIMDNILSPNKYPLHKAMEGHRPGDVVYFLGKKYEIVSVIND